MKLRTRYVALFALLASILPLSMADADEWPQWRGPERDGVWREDGVIAKFEGKTIRRRWSAPISSGYSGPTVADGRVYVSDRLREPREQERVHCFEWKTGKKLWTHTYDCVYREFRYPAGPRASVLIDGGRAYSLGAAGHLVCLDAKSGKLIWNKDLRKEYEIRMPDWGISASPIIAKDLIIVQIGGKGDACVVAFNKETGKESWRSLTDEASYSAPILVDCSSSAKGARKRVLVCWTANRIAGLEPSTGKLIWGHPFRYEKWPIAIADPVLHRPAGPSADPLLLFSEAHKGTLLLRMNRDGSAVEKVWHQRGEGNRSTTALHCLQSTPVVSGEHAYGVDNEGVLRCLDLDDGKQVWQDESLMPRARWATGYIVRNGERYWILNERGELIIASLSSRGLQEISRAKLLAPTLMQLRRRGGVTWSHPAFAYRHVFARNDEELVCADLSER